MTRKPIDAARALALGLLVAGVFTVPAAAERGVRSGPIYSSPKAVAEAQGILERDKYLRPGSYRRGEMDQATTDAIRAFQRNHFVRPSGQIDPETMGLLTAHGRGAAIVTGGVPLDRGATDLSDRVARDRAAAKGDEESVALTSKAVSRRSMPATGSPVAFLIAAGGLLAATGLALLLFRGV
jgi:peptidoglycan hydrolase-like protein with peptidoglycan-binding domain